MTLMPDLYRAYVDPFFAQPTLALFCDVLSHQLVKRHRDPRGTAKAALALQSLGIGDTAYFGPEACSFEDVKIDVSMNEQCMPLTVSKALIIAQKNIRGNLGHRPGAGVISGTTVD